MQSWNLSSTKVAAPEPLVSTYTSACPVKATTLKSAASKTRADPDNDNPVSSQSLNPLGRISHLSGSHTC